MPAFAGIHDFGVKRYGLSKSWIPGSAEHAGIAADLRKTGIKKRAPANEPTPAS